MSIATTAPSTARPPGERSPVAHQEHPANPHTRMPQPPNRALTAPPASRAHDRPLDHRARPLTQAFSPQRKTGDTTGGSFRTSDARSREITNRTLRDPDQACQPVAVPPNPRPDITGTGIERGDRPTHLSITTAGAYPTLMPADWASSLTLSPPTDCTNEANMTDGSLMDIATVAERLGVTPRFVRRLVAERRIPHYKVGHFVRFDRGEIDGWLSDRRREVRPDRLAA